MSALRVLTLSFLLSASMGPASASELKKAVPSFSRVIASPHINLVLTEGSAEEVQVVYDRIDQDKINIEVRGGTLHIFLDDARVTERTRRTAAGRVGQYEDVSVTAYVTYRNLRHLEIRGNQELTCNSPLAAEKFTLKAYGENEINLSSVKTGYLRTYLYGENRLKIRGGKADYQKYKLFGENRIDTRELKSFSTTATIFGESRVRLATQDELKVNSFGEAQVTFAGDAVVNRGLIFGETRIERLD